MINWKAALALAAVLIGLAVYALASRSGTVTAPPVQGLLPCDVVQTVDLKITGPAGKVVETRRAGAGGAWQLTQPGTGPADEVALNDLLTTAAQLQATDTLKTAPPARDLGLDPAQLTVGCTLAKGRSYTLSVGGQNFDGSGNYARVSGDAKVHVIPSATVAKFQQVLDQPPVRPSQSPSGNPSPNPSPSA